MGSVSGAIVIVDHAKGEKRMSKKEITCKCGCGKKKMVRIADIKRGWGKYFSKSCKAKHQEKKTGQYKNYISAYGANDAEREILEFEAAMDMTETGWDAHKDFI